MDIVKAKGSYCASCDALRQEVEKLRAIVHKLTVHNVTYWDNKGEVRHVVGGTQSEAMELFREARIFLVELGSPKNPGAKLNN